MAEKIRAWWGAHGITRRKLIQLYAALLYNAHIKGFITGNIYTGQIKSVCVPGFNCYSCPGATGACPLGSLQNALASSGNRAPYYVLGILALYGVILGRTICGWLCPLGLIQELLHKIPTPKLKKSRFTRALSWLKYVILAVFVVAIPLAYGAQRFPVPGFCKYICPAGTLEGAMGLLSNPANEGMFSILNILFTRKFIIMIVILTACIFIYRAFCRFICPLGAIYGLFSKVAIIGVKVDAGKCTNCGRCVAQCKMDIRRVGDHECIHCGECINECPTKAISMRCGKLTLLKNETAPAVEGETAVDKPRRARSIVAWSVALLALAFTLWYVNKPTEAESAQQSASEAAGSSEAAASGSSETATADGGEELVVGKEVGMLSPSFTVPLYGEAGGDFTLQKGRVTVVNFWATWCPSCIAELPNFEQLHETYGDKIDIIAIHSVSVSDDVQAFLDAEGYTIPFALDTDGSVIASFGGSTALPMTVIIDQSGKILYNKVGSITYEQLNSIVGPLV